RCPGKTIANCLANIVGLLLYGENPLDTLNDEQLILLYKFDRQSIYDLSDPALQLMIALRFYATGSFQAVIGDVFHVHKSTVCRVIHRISNAIAGLLNTVVKFPSKPEEDEIATNFFNVAGFPRVCGVIDGTHIRIQAPVQHEDQFINRKNQYSINVQLVSQWPGSTHDARILDESILAREFEEGRHKGILLGDSGYPCRSWLMTPFRNPESYNFSLCKTRAIIERVNGQLKRRFHCLHGELRVDPGRACRIILACVVLFNLSKGSEVEEDEQQENTEDVEEDREEGVENSGYTVRETIVQNFFSYKE
uniref:DDE Tnp4 domain-containing protein n=1 Tax=Paramormyrops kingsleyae TaxID=1676925 RepID=A0A3B3T239_9TELE